VSIIVAIAVAGDILVFLCTDTFALILFKPSSTGKQLMNRRERLAT